jgi:ornithine cyclodeaminase/alanine dehydrogenase-like protein (mu-crystallin family)
MAKHLELHSVLVCDRLPGRAEDLTERLRGDGFSPEVRAAEAEDAVTNATIIVTATTATSAYIPHRWIKQGSLIINVSLDDIGPETYLRSDLLYVDDWQLIIEDTQRLLGRLAREGVVSGPGEPSPENGRNVTGTLGQLLAGTCPSRSADTQTILVNPFGMAITDLSVAQAVCTEAVARGIGTWLTR